MVCVFTSWWLQLHIVIILDFQEKKTSQLTIDYQEAVFKSICFFMIYLYISGWEKRRHKTILNEFSKLFFHVALSISYFQTLLLFIKKHIERLYEKMCLNMKVISSHLSFIMHTVIYLPLHWYHQYKDIGNNPVFS